MTVDTGVHFRSFTPELEIRSGGDGRTIYGIAVPYGRPQQIDSRLTEQWRSGAFDHQLTAARRIPFAREHLKRGGTLIGATQLLRNDAAGLYGEWRVSKTVAGDETLELIKDGALSELSVGFYERQNGQLPGGIVERVKADLFEVAAVLQGAFGQLATAAGVRSAECTCGHRDGKPSAVEEARRLLADLPELTTAAE